MYIDIIYAHSYIRVGSINVLRIVKRSADAFVRRIVLVCFGFSSIVICYLMFVKLPIVFCSFLCEVVSDRFRFVSFVCLKDIDALFAYATR